MAAACLPYVRVYVFYQSCPTSHNIYRVKFCVRRFCVPRSVICSFIYAHYIYSRHRRLKGIHFRSDTKRTGAEGLSFYYFRLLNCLDQMLAAMSLSQHRVSSSKTVRPRAPCGARCIGHAVSTWSAVCSKAPHSQFGEGARPHLCNGRMESPNTSSQAVELNPSCSG